MKEPLYFTDDENDKLIDRILKTDAIHPLPGYFAERVAQKAVLRMALKQSLIEFSAFTGIILVLILTFLTVFYFQSKETWEKWTDFLVKHLYILTGAGLVLVFILLIDLVVLPQVIMIRSFKKLQDEILI